ncbi:cation diffusion facilitator family transporter [Aliterella atlantica]|uniref:Cation transporter n=1 Tax=Aliterella atlantica CENA595 TaxID=1618023 RepID=A0A0D8ZWB2_9CYAN|nr:cation diffusion facilitator family transporter [Aliterella atlantica]KJH73073.1 hypothetical protein UH38_03130 [Aliterella atlantica CENA595]
MALSVKQVLSRRAAVGQACCESSSTSNQQKTRRLWLSLVMLGSFFVAELVTGLWSGSLALQAEAGHILADLSALGLTLLATHFATQPADKKATFGHQRVEILAALANSIALIAIATFIGWEALTHLKSPEPVMGLPMLIVSTVGLVINGINIALLHEHSHHDLNVRGVFLHMVADAASSVGAMLAALVIYLWGWMWVDGAIALLIACFVIYSALPIVQQSWEILMEYAPSWIDPVEVEAALTSFNGVESVDKLNIWTISTNKIALAARLTVNSDTGRDRLVEKLEAHLRQEFGTSECTLQLTSAKKADLHPLLNSNLIDLVAPRNSN